MTKQAGFKSKRMGLIVAVLVGFGLLAAGLGAATYLTSMGNDLRSQADVPEPYGKCPNGTNMECAKGHECRKSDLLCYPIQPTRTPTVAPNDCTGFAKEGESYCGSSRPGNCYICKNGFGVKASDTSCTGKPCGPVSPTIKVRVKGPTKF